MVFRLRIRELDPGRGERPECPRPRKVAYATREAAELHVHSLFLTRGRILETYLCDCGWWHVAGVRKGPQPGGTRPVVGGSQ